MCGIIGLLASPETQARRVDVSATLALLHTRVARLHGSPAVPEARADIVATIATELENLATAAAAHELLAADDGRQLLSNLGDRLAAAADEADRFHGAISDISEREDWGRLAVTLRDLAWRAGRDILGALEAVARYSTESPHALPGAFLFHLERVLRGVDRLEIRGRDSAGLAIVVGFPSTKAKNRWRASVPGDELAHREDLPGPAHLAVAGGRSKAARAIAFVYKTAAEVGHMGDNVRTLREAICSDALLASALAEPRVVVSFLAHTRWASNGLVSMANAHPQLDVPASGAAGEARVLAVLNGDIDNFPQLRAAWSRETGQDLPAGVTTDASIIPLLVRAALVEGSALPDGLRTAARQFEGSFAICAVDLATPDRLALAAGGSGQTLDIGTSPDGPLVASEVYGLVETTSDYVHVAGDSERVTGDPASRGRIVALDRDGIAGMWGLDGEPVAAEDRPVRRATVTTRDIDIGGHRHFFAKEIHQGPTSVAKTLETLLSAHAPSSTLGAEWVPEDIVDALRSHSLRRIVCVGQGTAAVAAGATAASLERLLGGQIAATALPATELSGHALRDDMSDTLIVAVSQSGTTTDTNRTVELARQRGARVLAIVNRRGSDLTHRADGVLYTSDGRDVEMSVASTKAFYAQVTAGHALAVRLAEALATTPPERLAAEAAGLRELPAHMAAVLSSWDRNGAGARDLMLRRRHWAVVGSGPNAVAAAEIRIKLSELCYKSVALDFLEDKKHIDLSSEPLVIVCAAGLDETNLADAVKEVAIFRAHRATSIVITDAPDAGFADYAESVIVVPRSAPALSPVLVAMAGHLLGYAAATAMEEAAVLARRVRVALIESESADGTEAGPPARALVEQLATGRLDAGIDAGLAARFLLDLHELMAPQLGGEPLLRAAETDGSPRDRLLATLHHVITELSRPIDAIRHQAKTVTVGVSRAEPLPAVLAAALTRHGLPTTSFGWDTERRLRALAPLVAGVDGTTLYEVVGLTPSRTGAGRARIRKVASSGVAAKLASRTDSDPRLTGTKWLAAHRRELWVGRGRRDGRLIAVLPLVPPDADEGQLLLMHIQGEETAPSSARRAFLAAWPGRLDDLVAAVTETGATWDDELLGSVPVELLLADERDAAVAIILDA